MIQVVTSMEPPAMARVLARRQLRCGLGDYAVVEDFGADLLLTICMNLDEIVRQLKEERSRLDAAITALEGGQASSGKRRGRPPGKTKSTPARSRRMSAAARKRIADAMKARWAAAKKSGKKRL